MEFRYVFGPVPSRRLGRSLGVNPIPLKTCNYSCVYCQLGRTSFLTNTRRDFFPPGKILEEVRAALDLHAGETDYVTFVGEGEPSLCKSLGTLIGRTKEMTHLPVAVITNGALLLRRDVRQELARADVVMPSLDAADSNTFERINRPYGGVQIEEIIDGMVRFRERFGGRLWMEIMLIGGVNDQEEVLKYIRKALKRISPDRVYVNIPIRPPAEGWVELPNAEGLVRAQAILGDVVFMDQPEDGAFSTAGFDNPFDAVLAIVRRHPMQLKQIAETLDPLLPEAIQATLKALEGEGKIRKIVYRGNVYYATGEGRYAGRG